MRLQEAVVRAVRQPDNREMFRTAVSPAFEHDVLGNAKLINDAVRLVLSREGHATDIGDFSLSFHKVGDDRYRAETNIPQTLGIDLPRLHDVLKSALLGVGGMNQRIGEMRAHIALSGFSVDEVPLFRSKLDSLADAVGSINQERRFQRIVTIAGLPEIGSNARVDIEKLSQLREEPETLEFRAWLADTDKLSDAELQQRLSSLNCFQPPRPVVGFTCQGTEVPHEGFHL